MQWGTLNATHFQSLNQMWIFEKNVEKDGLIFIQGICFSTPAALKTVFYIFQNIIDCATCETESRPGFSRQSKQ